MAHTSTHNYLHVVFGTKERASSIPEILQPRLWAYMAGICKNYEMVAFAIGGITRENLPQVQAAGLNRIAVSGAVLDAADPATAVRELVEQLAPGH